MSPPLWVSELADAFWVEAGGPEGYPRGLRQPLLRVSFNLVVEEMSRLSTGRVEARLAALGCPRRCGAADRRLRGCLVADRGGGLVFLDADDHPAERTFSLAHELAHFLRDYWQRRRRAVAALGEAVLEALDGQRRARPGERLHGVLSGRPLDCHVHLMRRSSGIVAPEVDRAERDADRLALELLAPAAEVRHRLGGLGGADEAQALLVREFGLPGAVAAKYAGALVGRPEPTALVARLKMALEGSQRGDRGNERPA